MRSANGSGTSEPAAASTGSDTWTGLQSAGSGSSVASSPRGARWGGAAVRVLRARTRRRAACARFPLQHGETPYASRGASVVSSITGPRTWASMAPTTCRRGRPWPRSRRRPSIQAGSRSTEEDAFHPYATRHASRDDARSLRHPATQRGEDGVRAGLRNRRPEFPSTVSRIDEGPPVLAS